MSAKVLVTGGLGYLGGRIAQTLVAAGCDVYCGTRRTGVSPPAWLPQARMVRLDWNQPDWLRHACAGMDCVVHLAAMNEIESAKDVVGALRMNGQSTLTILEAAVAEGISRFVYVSTAHVYGTPLHGHIDEKTLPRPHHPYAITHRVAEDFVLAAHDQRRLQGVVFRLSNGFGAPATHEVDRWTLVVNDLCRQAASNGELRLNTAGTQLRDFITLEDVARAVVHVLKVDAASLGDGLFNLGGNASCSIYAMARQVAARWQALTGNDLEVFRPEPTGADPAPLTYSCEKFRATGFQWTSGIQQEIDATLRLCRVAFGG